MKKLLVILFTLLLVNALSAQTVSGYFSELGKGTVAQFNQKGYVVGVTALGHPADTALTYSSRAFGTSASLPRDCSGKKIYVGIQIDTAFADVDATLTSEISGDNSNWVTFSTVDSDTNPQTTGVTWYLLDLTNVYAPYVRLKFNASGLVVGIGGDLKFLYAIPL